MSGTLATEPCNGLAAQKSVSMTDKHGASCFLRASRGRRQVLGQMPRSANTRSHGDE